MLKVWFPGTNDTEDYGLGGTQWINDNVVVADNGKLGKCLSFNGSNSRFSTTNFELSNNWSFACWAKDDASVTNWRLLIMLNTTGSDADTQMSFWLHTGEKRFEVCANGKYISTVKYVPSQWNHFAATYNGSQLLVYLNGVKVYTLSNTNAKLERHNLTIGARGTNANGGHAGATSYFYGLVNDLRIWDNEILSPREIKEIAKGLVLHYPLSGIGQENLLSKYVVPGQNNPNNYNTAGRTEYYGDYGIIIPATSNGDTYFRLFLKQPLIQNEIYTISCYASGLLDGTQYSFPLFYQNNVNMGILSINHNGLCFMTFTMISYQPATVNVNDETLYVCFMDDITRNIATGQGAITIKNFKIEKGSIPTPWLPNSVDPEYATLGLNDGIEYDVSGYKNNGIKIGDMTYSSDTPRYQTSTNFNGIDNGILIQNLPLSDIINTSVTYSFWIKPSNENGGRSVYFGSYSGTSWSIEKTTANKIRGYWNGNPDVTYSNAIITDNAWQHVCITKNGKSDVKIYINGVLKETSTAAHNTLSFPTTFRIGRDTRSGDGTPYKGLMSDFRIYATALSAEDVLELYHTPITLSSNGTLLTQGEYVES